MSLVAKHLFKSFGSPATQVLKGISLEIKDGEFVALTGKSGSGKSTLLYILSTLDQPSNGDLYIDGRDFIRINQHDLHLFRNKEVGFVFQFHYLLPELSALDNVMMPILKIGASSRRKDYAKHLLELIGLSHRMNHFPHQMSGGEQQRVAIARALVMNPRYLFADEPTGSLDTSNTENVFSLFKKAHEEFKTTIVMVTHDKELAHKAQRTIELSDGKIIF